MTEISKKCVIRGKATPKRDRTSSRTGNLATRQAGIGQSRGKQPSSNLATRQTNTWASERAGILVPWHSRQPRTRAPRCWPDKHRSGTCIWPDGRRGSTCIWADGRRGGTCIWRTDAGHLNVGQARAGMRLASGQVGAGMRLAPKQADAGGASHSYRQIARALHPGKQMPGQPLLRAGRCRASAPPTCRAHPSGGRRSRAPNARHRRRCRRRTARRGGRRGTSRCCDACAASPRPSWCGAHSADIDAGR